MLNLLHNIPALIQTIGLLGVLAIVFAESGLLIGFFLPGDSLLFTAGLLASQGYLSFPLLLIGAVVAAIAGDSVGYWFGAKIGPLLFTREDSWLFRKSHIERTQHYFAKYGSKTILLARFMPIVRTFAPVLAGVGKMKYRTFLTYNIVGGTLWALGMPILGFVLGTTIPNVDRYLLPLILLIIVLSFVPAVIEIIRERRHTSPNEKKSIG